MVAESAAPNGDWIGLGIPEEVIPAAVAAFGDPERAKTWIEILGRAPLRMTTFGFEPLWRNVAFLTELAAAGIEPEDFERWRAAGLDAAAVPRTVAALRPRGVGPEEFSRWKSAGLDPRDLPAALAHLDFDAALDMLTHWRAPWPVSSTGELLEVFRRGVTAEQVTSFLALGLSGHQVFEWNSRTIPVGEWHSWMALSADHEVADRYYKEGFTASDAGPWIRAGVPVGDVPGYMQLGLGSTEAAEYVRQGIRPGALIAGDEGLEEVDYDELMTREDLTALPAEIQPGEFSFIRQSRVAGGDHVPYDFAFSWNGKRRAAWYMDISITASLSPASSSPSTGTISWANRRDLAYTHDWEELHIHEKGVLKGEAPRDPHDPSEWIRLADLILEIVFSH